MELGRTRTFGTGLALLALMVAAAALGLALLASEPKIPEIPASAPKVQQNTEQEMKEVWENLIDAIRREDQAEALELAERLDSLQKTRRTGVSETTPMTNLRIVQLWCEIGGHGYDFCEEENDVK